MVRPKIFETQRIIRLELVSHLKRYYEMQTHSESDNEKYFLLWCVHIQSDEENFDEYYLFVCSEKKFLIGILSVHV